MFTPALLAYRVAGTTSVCKHPQPQVHRQHQAASSQHLYKGEIRQSQRALGRKAGQAWGWP